MNRPDFTCADCPKRHNCGMEKATDVVYDEISEFTVENYDALVERYGKLYGRGSEAQMMLTHLEHPFDPHEAWNRVRRRVGLPERERRFGNRHENPELILGHTQTPDRPNGDAL